MDNLEKIYKEVAQEMGLSRSHVQTIAESQFSLVAKKMRDKDLNNIRMQFFGEFRVKPGRLKFLSDEGKELINEKINESNKIL